MNIQKQIRVVLSITFLLLISCSSNKEPKPTKSPELIKKKESTKELEFKKYNDGPYVLLNNDKPIEKSIVEGSVQTKKNKVGTYQTDFIPEGSVFSGASKIVAMSDIHGQHDVFVSLIKKHHIVDKNLDWAFGDGHFVITGDIFDRGDKVLDSLWLIFKLEKQAEEQGGKVHYLLGNHEYMVLSGNTKYLHNNYILTARLLNTEYKELFNESTVLGRWIRSKSTVIKINETVFLHAGISQAFLNHKSLNKGFDYQVINQRYRETIGIAKKEIKKNPDKYALHDKNSPIWYRGYVRKQLSDEVIDDILSRLKASHIVVGHTSLDEIVEFNNGKVYAIDAKMKKGKRGELLYLLGDEVYRLTFEGKRIKFK